MQPDQLWQAICNSFTQNPRDVITVPKTKKGKWFFVYAENGKVYIESSKEHSDTCRIRNKRLLEENKCQEMLGIYQRRCQGEKVTGEATKVTYNQVYWYGIFADLGI